MENQDFDSLLLEAVQSDDPFRRDQALQQLVRFAERVAATRSPGHAQSVANEAVNSVHGKVDREEVAFKTTAQLMTYLKQVALGKAIDRVRNDQRHLGPTGSDHSEDGGGPRREPSARDAGASTIVGRRELEGLVHDWMARVPTPIRPAAAVHLANVMSGLEADQRLGLLQEVEAELGDLSSSVERVLGLLPEVLRGRAGARIGRADYGELAGLLLQMEGMLLGARGLKPEHRLAVEMREAGWEPKEIADKLGMSPENVRVVHHRLAKKLMGQAEAEEPK